MHINSITLTNFRNYQSFSQDFNAEGHVFYGDNGTGKTNLLEAICYLAYGKSFRANSDIDLINYDKDYFRIEGLFVHHNESHTFEAALDRKGRKIIKINDKKIDKISELYHLLKVVFFSQEDINLISGAPKKRRHYFDLAISQYNYHYIEILKRYTQIVKQRNTLLKTKYLSKEKRAWDEQFVDTATSLINIRNEYLKTINKELADSSIDSEKELLLIRYRYSFPFSSKEALSHQIKNELQKLEPEEQRQERTLIGPHLDDYLFTMNHRPINRFGSHGQKRCFVILLGLAQARLLTKADKDTSIMIFDDVLSDLDDTRTKAILSVLNESNQIFIGTPNPEPYRELKLPLINLKPI